MSSGITEPPRLDQICVQYRLSCPLVSCCCSPHLLMLFIFRVLIWTVSVQPHQSAPSSIQPLSCKTRRILDTLRSPLSHSQSAPCASCSSSRLSTHLLLLFHCSSPHASWRPSEPQQPLLTGLPDLSQLQYLIPNPYFKTFHGPQFPAR